MGIDMTMHTVSKYIGGHSDLIAGIECGSEALMRKIRDFRSTYGGILSPFDAFLATRGLRTLPVRLAAHEKAALKVAKFLERHPKVERVLYPALESHPQHQLYRAQMSGACGLIMFVPSGASFEDASKIVDNLRYFQITCSWGGYESLAIAFTIDPQGSAGKFYGLKSSGAVRIHVGTENTKLLMEDLSEALK